MKLVDLHSYDTDKWIDPLGLFGAIDLKDEQNIATDGSSLEPENERDDEVSRIDKGIILGLEEIIEELKYNNSNIDALRAEFDHFRDENVENFHKMREHKNNFEKPSLNLMRQIFLDVSSIRSILFWVLIVIPIISFIFMIVMMS